MNKPEDDLLINRILQGGPVAEEAFSDLAVYYGPKIYQQVFRILRDENLAQDAIQNTFIKIWRNLHQFNKECTLFSWIYRIAHNEALTILSKEKKQKDFVSNSPIVEWSGHSGFSDQLNTEEISNLLLEAIDMLPEKQAQTFQLKYFDDLKYSEISELLGTSEGALKANFHIASEKIKEFLLSQLNH
jgi:RNA polymerase sigma factor (sigma-70 family)